MTPSPQLLLQTCKKKLREKEKGRKEEEGKRALRNFQNDIVAHVIPIEERNQAATDLSVLFRACTILNGNTLSRSDTRRVEERL